MPSILEARPLAAAGTFPFEAVALVALMKQPRFHDLDWQMRGGGRQPAPSPRETHRRASPLPCGWRSRAAGGCGQSKASLWDPTHIRG